MKFTIPFLLSLIMVSPLITMDTHAEAPHKGACKSDVELHCKGVEPGEGRIADCLKDHQSLLTPACKIQSEVVKENVKEKRIEVRAKMGQIREACKEHKKKFCKNVFGPMKVTACLNEHYSELSAECKAILPAKKD
jgi:hypothetical protein